MTEKRDDVLSLESGDEKSFSGFSSGEEEVELLDFEVPIGPGAPCRGFLLGILF